MLYSTGTLIVTPSGRTGCWWVHVLCCEELGRFYRYMVIKTHGPDYATIQRPLWGPHVTVIRREMVPYDMVMNWHQRTIEFAYDNEFVKTNEKHFWMPIRCESLKNIRTFLHLPRNPFIPLHLTFGVMPGPDKSEP